MITWTCLKEELFVTSTVSFISLCFVPACNMFSHFRLKNKTKQESGKVRF